jgi:HEAT repeat protein
VDELFDVFRDRPYDIARCREAVDALVALPESDDVAARARDFLATEPQDEVRTWAIAVLRRRPDRRTFAALLELARSDDTRGRDAKYARLYTLDALVQLADTPKRKADVDALLAACWADDREDLLPRTYAMAAATLHGSRDARLKLAEMFASATQRRSYWQVWALLRALREVPPGPADGPLAALVQDQLMALIRDPQAYNDHCHTAIELLGRFPPSLDVVRGIGEVLVSGANEYLRLRAAVTLGVLGDAAASRDLVAAATDENAEVRVQAARSLELCVGTDRAIAALVEAAMEDGATEQGINSFVDALRMLDRDRMRSTELLGKVLAGDDRGRAQCAERMLLDLGGWSAVQRLGQRRATLDQLDALLAESEKVVQETFQRTIRQAQASFYFALVVNALVVVVGLVLVGIAVSHLVREPEDLESWLLPGGTGVLAVVLNLYFNNPRQNAREDLAALVNVNVLFLGYLRQLNQIDATFKHSYIESRDFSVRDMQATVNGIQRAVDRTLAMAAVHLRFRDRGAAAEDVRQWEPAPANGEHPALADGEVPAPAGQVS